MAVTILDHCPSCGVCSRKGVCPTDAIKVENGKTVISEGCIDCGLCIPVCPIGVIVRLDDTPSSTVQETSLAGDEKQESAPVAPATDGEEEQDATETSTRA